jgi:putative transposase
MPEHTGSHSNPSTVVFETLEKGLRQQVQGWLQDLLEEEVTSFLGRLRSQRRPSEVLPGTSHAGYRNGHGKPRSVTTAVGTVTIQRPRLRGLDERFESRVLPLFARRTAAVEAFLPQLYLHGLATGDFDEALRGLLGEDAALSASTMVRLKAKWQQEYDAWRQRPLSDLEVVYLEAPAHDQSRGEPVRGGAAAHVCGEAVQAGGERHGDDLEAADGSGAELPESERA